MSDRTVPLISEARHRYDGTWLKRGDPFMASAQDAEDLITLRFATKAQDTALYATRVMEADTPRTKRAYHRRDVNSTE